MSYGVGRRHGSDPAMLWPWHRLVATAPNRPLTWKHPYATGAAQEIAKKTKKNFQKVEEEGILPKTFYEATIKLLVNAANVLQ